MMTIVLNPLAFILMERLRRGRPVLAPAPDSTQDEPATTLRPTSLSDHDVLIGYGRVGSLIGRALADRGGKMLVIETSDDGAEKDQRFAAPHGASRASGGNARPVCNLSGERQNGDF